MASIYVRYPSPHARIDPRPRRCSHTPAQLSRRSCGARRALHHRDARLHGVGPVGGGPARSLIYRTHSLDTPNDQITRALIMVHGTNRNADHYFETATAAASSPARSTTPSSSRRASLRPTALPDKLAANEISWRCGGDSWRSGGIVAAAIRRCRRSTSSTRSCASSPTRTSSRTSRRSSSPATRRAASSSTRYEMANSVHDTLGVPVSYVVANPSSYAWPDATRPLPVGRRRCRRTR